MTLQHERIAAIVEAYDNQGIHRTATSVDRQSADWLADEVRAIGLAPNLEGFELERVDPGENYIEASGRRIEGVPLFDCTYTDTAGITGRVGPPQSGSEIVLLNDDSTPASVHKARSSLSAQALVVCSLGHNSPEFAPASQMGLALINAQDFRQPFGAPVLQVAPESGAWLRQQAEAGMDAKIVVHARRTVSTAYNVTAEIPGDGPPLAISTPRSGWWEIAAERGSGIACWLDVMRALATATTRRRTFFCANSGHELGFMGMEAVLDAHPELAATATWLHFGANIGARSGQHATLSAADEQLRSLAQAHLARVDRPTKYVTGDPGGGEMVCVHARGGRRFMALTNDNAYFHMRADRYPDNVDIPLVAQFADASVGIAKALAAETS